MVSKNKQTSTKRGRKPAATKTTRLAKAAKATVATAILNAVAESDPK